MLFSYEFCMKVDHFANIQGKQLLYKRIISEIFLKNLISINSQHQTKNLIFKQNEVFSLYAGKNTIYKSKCYFN